MTANPELDPLLKLISEALGGDLFALQARHFVLEEEPSEYRCRVRLDLYPSGGGAPDHIEGKGVGIVDATFNATRDALASVYPSVRHVTFEDFLVKGDMGSRRDRSGSDALASVELVVSNQEGRLFTFKHRSRSITSSTLHAVLDAVSYFVNAERAVRVMVRAIEDARSRNRGDLVEAYTMKLSELVKNVSYADVVRDVRDELDA